MADLLKKVPDWMEIDLQLFAEKDSGDKDDSGDKKDNDQDNDQDGGGDTGKKTGEKSFTQEDLDKIIRDRIKRERKAWEQKIEDEKKKAAMTESERLKAEKEESEKKAQSIIERANQRLIRSEVIAQAAGLKIIDPEAAFALMDKTDVKVEDDDRVTGVKEALEDLVKSKPYLVGKASAKKTGDDQSDDKSKKSGSSMNDLIRKAAGIS
jgi:LPS O-antigen subunit length determinant protein (WzzB/FepE family)